MKHRLKRQPLPRKEVSEPMDGIFDTHAHYTDAAFDADRTELLTNFPQEGVSHVMLCGCSVQDSRDSLALAEPFPHVYCAVGVHPENLDNLESDWLEQIRFLAKSGKVRAIGEIGLDYHYEGYDAAMQKEVFTAQLRLAAELDLPVILHVRDAMGDMMEILHEYRPKGVLHCYSGSKETAKEALRLGLYLGFGGVLTFKNARHAVETMEILPLDRMLLETDCPYLAPVPYRGKRCDSRMIALTAARAAEIRGMEPQEIIDICRENALRLFGLKG